MGGGHRGVVGMVGCGQWAMGMESRGRAGSVGSALEVRLDLGLVRGWVTKLLLLGRLPLWESGVGVPRDGSSYR